MKCRSLFYALSLWAHIISYPADDTNHDQFVSILKRFIKNKKRAVVDHIKKAQKSFEECSRLIRSGEQSSENTGFYYIQTISDEEHRTNATRTCLSPLFKEKYDEMLGFQEDIIFDTQHRTQKSQLDFFKDFECKNPTTMQELFLMRVFSQFKASHRGFIKTQKSMLPHAEKIEKAKQATQLILASLRYDYETIGKQKRFSERPKRSKYDPLPLIESKSF